jgi:hypothetical protein
MLSAVQENALYTWLNGQTGITTSWKDQKAPEPAYPFAQLKVISGPTREGFSDSQEEAVDDTNPTGEEITITLKGPRLYTVTIDAYANSDVGGANAQHYISLAEKGLEKPSVRLALLVAGIAVVEVMPPVDLDETVNVEWVSRCKFDLRIRVNSTVTDSAGYIEQINITGTVGDQSVSLIVDEVTFMSHYGELVLDTPAATTIATPGTYVAVAGTFSISDVKDFELDGTNGLKYTGSETKRFLVHVAGSVESDTISKAYFKLAVDGVVDDDSRQQVELVAAGEAENLPMTALIALAEDEVLTLHVTADDALDLTANTLVITPIAA